MRSTFVSFLTTLLIAMVGAVSAATTGSLFEALRRDDPVAVAAAATHAVDVNTPDDSGTTPLMYAVLYSRPAVVELLLDRGAAVNAANRFGSTALMGAAPARSAVGRRRVQGSLTRTRRAHRSATGISMAVCVVDSYAASSSATASSSDCVS